MYPLDVKPTLPPVGLGLGVRVADSSTPPTQKSIAPFPFLLPVGMLVALPSPTLLAEKRQNTVSALPTGD